MSIKDIVPSGSNKLSGLIRSQKVYSFFSESSLRVLITPASTCLDGLLNKLPMNAIYYCWNGIVLCTDESSI
jgi:hypothetical protein